MSPTPAPLPFRGIPKSIFALRRQMALTAMLLTAPASTILADDRIYPKQGSSVSGSITEIGRDKVVIEVRGTPQTFETPALARVVFDGEPSTLSRVKELAANGQWDQAQEEIKKIDPESVTGDAPQAELAYYSSWIEGNLALTGRADPGSAAKGLLAYFTANKDSHHFYEGTETLGELATLLGNYDRASVYFGALAKAPYPQVALRSKVLEARALLSQQKFAEARTVCSEAIATAATDPATLRSQLLAKVVLARCDISEGKTADAIQNLQKLIQENDSTDSQLFAALYNAQGEALQKEQKWEQAVLAYLHSDLLFSNNPESHAEALYHLSQLWAKLGEPQRAAEAKEKLTTLYAGSAWAKK